MVSVLINTKCADCNHNKVCGMLDHPFDVAKNIQDKVVMDMNAVVIEVSCEHFDKKADHTVTLRTDSHLSDLHFNK